MDLKMLSTKYRAPAEVVGLVVGALAALATAAWALGVPQAKVQAIAVDAVAPRLDAHDVRIRAVEEAQRAMPEVQVGVRCLLLKSEGKPCPVKE